MTKKKEPPRRPKGAGNARGQNAANQVAAARRSQKSAGPDSLTWLRSPSLVIVAIALLAAVLLFVARWTDYGQSQEGKLQNDESNSEQQIPHINGMATELDQVLWDKTRDFLNNFVCNYHPAATEMGMGEFDTVGGYCHPRLSAVPHHRTHQVSSRAPKDLQNWWEKIQHYITGKSGDDHGILAGELVMKLPRPLQIWDLDALRDRFIQQEFLGLSATNDNGSSDADTMEPTISSKVAARHQGTQNPLDSGAFLTVHLIRLLQGSQAGKISSDDVTNDGQCQNNESGECKQVQLQWDDLEQHKQRISVLSAYLDVLPTVEDRIAKSAPSRNNAHSHPLFWSASLLQSLFPRYTHTYDLIRHYQQMAESEYAALKLASDEFGKNVKYFDYLSMRINVLSRAFGVSASTNDTGNLWGALDDMKGTSLMDEMKLYETSNFGSFLKSDEIVEEFKLRSMCPLLDMYNSHPNPNVSWRYDSKTSSFEIHATQKDNIPPGNSIVVSYGKYTDGHLFAKYGYVNGDGSSPTEISFAVFHRMLGDVGLGRQFSQLPFQVWDPESRYEIFGTLLDGESNVNSEMQNSISSAKQALAMQSKELLRYLIFDDGYKECIDLTADSNPRDEELKLLKLRHLILLANYRDAWIVRIRPKFPDARPLQSLSIYGKDLESSDRNNKNAMGVNANRIVSICRLLSLRADDIGGEAIDYLRDGITSVESSSPSSSSSDRSFFFVEKHEDALEYRAMMCVIRFCNVALGRYLGRDNAEPELVGSREWNSWYITTGEVRAIGIVQSAATNEANRLRRKYQVSEGSMSSTDAMTVREEGACPLSYSLPLLSRL